MRMMVIMMMSIVFFSVLPTRSAIQAKQRDGAKLCWRLLQSWEGEYFAMGVLSLIVRDWENRNISTILCFQEVFQQSQGFQKSSLRSEVIFNHSTAILTFREMDFFLLFENTSSQTFESLSWFSLTCVLKYLVDIVTSSIGFGWWIYAKNVITFHSHYVWPGEFIWKRMELICQRNPTTHWWRCFGMFENVIFDGQG